MFSFSSQRDWARRYLNNAWRMTCSVTLAATVGLMAAEPTKIIFDTDIGGDVDDAGAMAVLNHLADTGDAEILAVISSKDTDTYYGVGLIDAINTWYGRGNIPIGVNKDVSLNTDFNYCDNIAQDTALYGHNLVDATDAPSQSFVYHSALAGQPNGSVVICTVGTLAGLREYIEVYGTSRLANKVKTIVVMGGHYSNGVANSSKYDITGDLHPNTDGANLEKLTAGPDAKYVMERLPSSIEVVLSPMGRGIHAGGSLDVAPTENPVRESFVEFNRYKNLKSYPGYDLDYWKCYDQIAIYYAIVGNRDGLFSTEPATLSWDNNYDMTTTFGSGRPHKVLFVEDIPGMERKINHMMAAFPKAKAHDASQRIEAEHLFDTRGISYVKENGYSNKGKIGNPDIGDWISFYVDVPSTGEYEIEYRAAGKNSGSAWTLSTAGTVLGVLPVGDTGGYGPSNMQSFQSTLSLQAGKQLWRFEVTGADYPDLDYFELTPLSSNPNPRPESDHAIHIELDFEMNDNGSIWDEGTLRIQNFEDGVEITAVHFEIVGGAEFDWINSLNVQENLGNNNDGKSSRNITIDLGSLSESDGQVSGKFDIDPGSSTSGINAVALFSDGTQRTVSLVDFGDSDDGDPRNYIFSDMTSVTNDTVLIEIDLSERVDWTRGNIIITNNSDEVIYSVELTARNSGAYFDYVNNASVSPDIGGNDAAGAETILIDLGSGLQSGESVSYSYDVDGEENFVGFSATVFTLEASASGDLIEDTSGAYPVHAIELEPTSDTEPSFETVKVNFQPGGSSTPSGFVKDSGKLFDAVRGYGWLNDLSGDSRDRDISGVAQEYDTFVFGGSSNHAETWEYVLPNGEYLVTISLGDSQYNQGPLRATVEDVVLVTDKLTQANEYEEVVQAVIEVIDGRLSLKIGYGDGAYTGTIDIGSTDTTVNFIIIEALPTGMVKHLIRKEYFGS